MNAGSGQSKRSVSIRFGILRWLLGFSALVWGVSIYGVFASWQAASQALHGLGAQSIPEDRMLDYWLRMVSGVFTLVGAWYLVLMMYPKKYSSAIPWFGWLMIAEGLILLVHGARLSLPPFPFYGDVAACLLGGGGIVACASAAREL